MGVKNYQRWFTEKGFVAAGTPQIDHLYIDVPGILHSIMRKASFLKIEAGSRESHIVHSRIHQSLTRTLAMYSPTKSMTIAFDGPAPLAKAVVQGARRLARANQMADDEVDAQLALTPGVPFMLELEASVEFWILNRLLRRTAVKFIMSDSTVPGEGEMKLLSLMKTNARNYPKDSHLLYSSDSDLIVMACFMAVPNVYIAPMEVTRQNQSRDWQDRSDSKRIINSIPAVAEAIRHKCIQRSAEKPGFVSEALVTSIMRDVGMLALLPAGNDYFQGAGVKNSQDVHEDVYEAYMDIRFEDKWKNRSLVVVDAENNRLAFDAEFMLRLMEEVPSSLLVYTDRPATYGHVTNENIRWDMLPPNLQMDCLLEAASDERITLLRNHFLGGMGSSPSLMEDGKSVAGPAAESLPDTHALEEELISHVMKLEVQSQMCPHSLLAALRWVGEMYCFGVCYSYRFVCPSPSLKAGVLHNFLSAALESHHQRHTNESSQHGVHPDAPILLFCPSYGRSGEGDSQWIEYSDKSHCGVWKKGNETVWHTVPPSPHSAHLDRNGAAELSAAAARVVKSLVAQEDQHADVPIAGGATPADSASSEKSVLPTRPDVIALFLSPPTGTNVLIPHALVPLVEDVKVTGGDGTPAVMPSPAFSIRRSPCAQCDTLLSMRHAAVAYEECPRLDALDLAVKLALGLLPTSLSTCVGHEYPEKGLPAVTYCTDLVYVLQRGVTSKAQLSPVPADMDKSTVEELVYTYLMSMPYVPDVAPLEDTRSRASWPWYRMASPTVQTVSFRVHTAHGWSLAVPVPSQSASENDDTAATQSLSGVCTSERVSPFEWVERVQASALEAAGLASLSRAQFAQCRRLARMFEIKAIQAALRLELDVQLSRPENEDTCELLRLIAGLVAAALMTNKHMDAERARVQQALDDRLRTLKSLDNVRRLHARLSHSVHNTRISDLELLVDTVRLEKIPSKQKPLHSWGLARIFWRRPQGNIPEAAREQQAAFQAEWARYVFGLASLGRKPPVKTWKRLRKPKHAAILHQSIVDEQAMYLADCYTPDPSTQPSRRTPVPSRDAISSNPLRPSRNRSHKVVADSTSPIRTGVRSSSTAGRSFCNTFPHSTSNRTWSSFATHAHCIPDTSANPRPRGPLQDPAHSRQATRTAVSHGVRPSGSLVKMMII